MSMSRTRERRIGLLKTFTLIPATLSFVAPPKFTTISIFKSTCSTICTSMVNSLQHRDDGSCQRTKPQRRRRPAWREVLQAPRCSSSAAASPAAPSPDSGGRDEASVPWAYVPAAVSSGTTAPKTSNDHDRRTASATGLRKDIGAESRTSTCTSGSRASGEVALVFGPPQLAPGRTLRSMQPDDVNSVVALAFEEYYESSDLLQAMSLENGGGGSRGIWGATWEWASTNGLLDQAGADRLVDWLEMEWLRAMIRWGFGMRIAIGEGGHDHRVFCVADDDTRRRGKRSSLLAVAEVSLQIPNGKTAPPLPLPIWLKRLRGWPIPVAPYISNVLVDPDARRQGLAKMLMARCEEQARSWGYTQVYLHVDLNYWPAVHLYESLGYEAVGEVVTVEPFIQSMDIPRLRFMKKIL